jgi:hypothetical protein
MQEGLKSFDLDSAGDAVISGATLACVAMIFFAGNAIAFSMITALLSTASVLYLLLKSKDTHYGGKIWRFTMKHRITTDVIISAAFVIMFGTGTATALLSAGAAGVMTSWALGKFANKYDNEQIDQEENNEVIETAVCEKLAS